MKALIFLACILLGSFAQAQVQTNSGLVVCFTGSSEPMFMNASYRCEQLKSFENRLQVTVLAMSIGAAVSSVTAVGIPVSVTLGIGAAGFGYLSFVVSEIDCDDDRKAFQEKVQSAVCEVLATQSNITCDPSTFLTTDTQKTAPMCTAGDLKI